MKCNSTAAAGTASDVKRIHLRDIINLLHYFSAFSCAAVLEELVPARSPRNSGRFDGSSFARHQHTDTPRYSSFMILIIRRAEDIR